jgi:hypothetical protein
MYIRPSVRAYIYLTGLAFTYEGKYEGTSRKWERKRE